MEAKIDKGAEIKGIIAAHFGRGKLEGKERVGGSKKRQGKLGQGPSNVYAIGK